MKLALLFFWCEALAQLVEHIPFKDGVHGSSPWRLTIFKNTSCSFNLKAQMRGETTKM